MPSFDPHLTLYSFGYRARTRSKFSRNFREHGQVNLSTYLRTFKVGDIVDIKGDARQQKGMPHSLYVLASYTFLSFFLLTCLATTVRPAAYGTLPPELLVLKFVLLLLIFFS